MVTRNSALPISSTGQEWNTAEDMSAGDMPPSDLATSPWQECTHLLITLQYHCFMGCLFVTLLETLKLGRTLCSSNIP